MAAYGSCGAECETCENADDGDDGEEFDEGESVLESIFILVE